MTALVAIVAMLTIAAASAAPAHFHTKTPASQCEICITAHVASSQAFGVIQLVYSPRDRGPVAVSSTHSGYCFLKSGPSAGRAPPSL
ncbi:MAG: hypothetical protein KGN84_21215 [Acidobacteriota bacterium]|nr:hypothetical protein [Acidobacteriota bacterium]